MVKVLGLHSDTNLKEALLSGHEIWIKGTYIAVRSGIIIGLYKYYYASI